MKRRAPTLLLIASLVISLLILPATPVLKTPAAAQGLGLNTGPVDPTSPGSPVNWTQAFVIALALGGCGAQSGMTTACNHLATGVYEVIFNDNVRDCVYLATIGLPGFSGQSPPGEITVVGRVTTVNGVFVTTHDAVGNPSDRNFHLLVTCYGF